VADAVKAYAGRKLPLWVKLCASAMGIFFTGFGMSRFLSAGPVREIFIPIVTGAIIIYVSGYERRLFMNEDGICRETSFWGQRRTETVRWDEIFDARVILNKGRRMYVILHAEKDVWPLTFNFEQKEEVLSLLENFMRGKDIKYEN